MDPRREPQQARSKRLVESVIEGALVVLRTQAPSTITTSQLADAAGCSQAAMFRFFTDKDSILIAAAEALQQRLRSRYRDTIHRQAAASTVPAVVRALVDSTADFLRHEPAWRSLRWGLGTAEGTLRALHQDTNREVAQLLVERFPRLRADPHAVLIAVESAGHLVGLAFEDDAQGDQRTLDAACEMTSRYLTVRR